MSPLGSIVLPPISPSTSVAVTSRAATLSGYADLSGSIPTHTPPSSRVELSGLGRMFSALSDLRMTTESLQETTATSITQQRVASFVAAMNRFTQTLAISSIDDGTAGDALPLPDPSQISNVLLQQSRATDTNLDLASIGMRFNADGNINIEPSQFSRALTHDPLRTIGLLAQATDRLDAMINVDMTGLRTTMSSDIALSAVAPPVSSMGRGVADFLAVANAYNAAALPLSVPTARAIRSFIDTAAL